MSDIDELKIAPYTGPGELHGYPAYFYGGYQVPCTFLDTLTDDELLDRARSFEHHPSSAGKPNIYLAVAALRALEELEKEVKE